LKASVNEKLPVTQAPGKQAMFLPGKNIHILIRSGANEAARKQKQKQKFYVK
jgi:hypothetical protein